MQRTQNKWTMDPLTFGVRGSFFVADIFDVTFADQRVLIRVKG